MPLIDIPIPNLVRGVSQQPPSARQPGQVERADDVLLHPVNGLSKRKGSRHLGRLFSGTAFVSGVHQIDRDADERFIVITGERRVRVFDATDGEEYPVVNRNGDPVNLAPPVGVPAAQYDFGIEGQAYLDPRREGTLRSVEDFNVTADNLDPAWTLTDVTVSDVAGLGPYRFGRFTSSFDGIAGLLLQESVRTVFNSIAAIGSLTQSVGVFSNKNVLSLHVKADPGHACNDVELALEDLTNAVTHTARFDLSGGVFTVGAVSAGVTAAVELIEDGWYRVWMLAEVGVVPTTTAGATRRVRLRWHTNAATPLDKGTLAFGARIDDGVSAPLSYVQNDTGRHRFLSIEDNTFVLDTLKVPAMIPGGGGSDNRAILFVRTGGLLDVNYQVVITYSNAGVPTPVTFTVTTPTTGPTGLRTDTDIAGTFATNIGADPNFLAARNGSVVAILPQNANNPILGIEATDSRGDSGIVAFLDEIEDFDSLPLVGANGKVVKVTGNPEREADDYYVELQFTSGSSTGTWVETRSPDVDFEIDSRRMPHQLQREVDDAVGTTTGVPFQTFFRITAVDWSDREVGDDNSNPVPSFIGSPIRDIFLHRGRLGFAAGDSLILSEAGFTFSFFRTTVLSLVESDPIDIGSGSRSVVEFRSVVSTADTAVAITDREQFRLDGDPALTPQSAQLTPIRTFAADARVTPAETARGVVFPDRRGAFCGLQEFVLVGDDTQFRFEDLTVHAPQYVNGRALQLVHNPITGITALLADGDQSLLFLHQTLWDDEENRVQSAWARWRLGDDAAIRSIGTRDTELVLVVERAEGWFLETIEISSDKLEGSRPVVHLDRRLTEADVTAVYDGPNNRTTFTLPYTITGDVAVVDAVSGLQLPVTAQTATTVTVTGDFSTAEVRIGDLFTMLVTLSEPVLQQVGDSGITPRMGRPLDVHLLHLYVDDTAYLRVETRVDLRPAGSEVLHAAGLGTGFLGAGVLNLYTGDASFSIISLSTELNVDLVNDTPFPSYVHSGRWELLNRQRAALT